MKGPYRLVKEVSGGLEFQNVVGPGGLEYSTCGDAYWVVAAMNRAYEAGLAAREVK